MKYDDAAWHYGGNFPEDLPDEAGATHIGMFAAWCVLNGLAGRIHKEDFETELSRLVNRQMTPGQWMLGLDGKLTDEDFSDAGNAFAQSYYADQSGLLVNAGSYLADYEAVFTDAVSLYHVEDSWDNYDAIAPVIGERHQQWSHAT